jgi:hypothetical protein
MGSGAMVAVAVDNMVGDGKNVGNEVGRVIGVAGRISSTAV